MRVPARLHLGFLDLNGGLGRRFGSIGLAISGRRTSITIGAAAQMRVTGPEHERVQELSKRCGALSICTMVTTRRSMKWCRPMSVSDRARSSLAVAAGLRRLHGLPWTPRRRHPARTRRALGVGIGLFEQGGLVVDGGRGSAQTPAPIRLPFPEQWRILVVLDPHRQGVHGPDERELFGKLAPCSDAEAAHLCRLVLMKALPALANCDIAAFGSAIKELQARLGDYFAPIQGGSRFSSPDVAAVLDLLESEGALGIGQSSWGPTGFAFVPSAEAADRLLARTRGDPVSETWTSVLAPGSTAERKSRLMRKRTSPSDNDGKQPARREVRHDRQEHPSHVDTAQAHEPVRREHGIGCVATMRCSPTRIDARVSGLVQDAMFSRPPKTGVRTGLFVGGKNAILALDMLSAAKKALMPPFGISLFADPAGSFHHRGGDGGLRGEDVARQEATQPEGLAVAVFGATGVVGFPPASSPQWKAPTSRSWATTASSA